MYLLYIKVRSHCQSTESNIRSNLRNHGPHHHKAPPTLPLPLRARHRIPRRRIKQAGNVVHTDAESHCHQNLRHHRLCRLRKRVRVSVSFPPDSFPPISNISNLHTISYGGCYLLPGCTGGTVTPSFFKPPCPTTKPPTSSPTVSQTCTHTICVDGQNECGVP